MEKKKNSERTGLITLLVCGVLAMALIIAVVFFPEQLFGLFQ